MPYAGIGANAHRADDGGCGGDEGGVINLRNKIQKGRNIGLAHVSR